MTAALIVPGESKVTKHVKNTDLQKIIDLLIDGNVVVIIGPFGAGKSLTAARYSLKRHASTSGTKIDASRSL